MAPTQGSIVIVGYGSGVSDAVAQAFAREGHSLVLIARDEQKLSSALRRFHHNGVSATSISADAGDEASLRAALIAAQEAFGAPSVLLYNAARWRPGPALKTTPETFEADFRSGVTGALIAAQTLAPAMTAQGWGTLLFTGGGLALHPSPQAPSLSIAKAGIRALALMLAEELAPKGVRVGTVTIMGQVAPGTPFAPEKIAAAFLSLHRSPPDPATSEILFTGA